MPQKFVPGQRIVLRQNGDSLYGNIISIKKLFVKVQFDGFTNPKVLDELFSVFLTPVSLVDQFSQN